MENSEGQRSKSESSFTGNFNTINFAFSAGMGFNYQISEGLQLNFEPILRCSYTSIVYAPIKQYLFSSAPTLE